MPARASNHEKFTVFDGQSASAVVGSTDLARSYWDDSRHLAVNPRRWSDHPAHEVGVRLTGPIVGELAAIFERAPRALTLRGPESPHAAAMMQIVRTVPAWAPEEADTSLWRTWSNAVTTAERYIYIEDQYFWPDFGNSWPGEDPLTLLRGALRRGVDVILLLPLPRRQQRHPLRFAHRHNALMRLVVEAAQPRRGKFSCLFVARGTYSVHIHSKVLLVDDEFTLIGTANVNRRSMLFDREIAVAVLDSAFATKTRVELWSEHMGGAASRDLQASINELHTATGHLKPYPIRPGTVSKDSLVNRALWDLCVDPLPKRGTSLRGTGDA
jgi:phosphatidylserine/phosphatidylglycerophosphate/cardiolipin synthase-like enzyme